jgi:putative glutamine amidotransferase
MKPIIGITPSAQTDDLAHGTFRRYCLNEAYVRAVEAAGGVPIILPPHADPARIVGVIDGLLLSGGPDVEPSRFGDTTIHPMTYGIDPERDQFEIDLFSGARERRLPVLGICRGIQVINVALGGTLIQDVSSESEASREVGHRQHERGLDESAVGHEVHTELPSLLPIFDGNCLGVNSFHHQAIRDLAPELNAVAYSPDVPTGPRPFAHLRSLGRGGGSAPTCAGHLTLFGKENRSRQLPAAIFGSCEAVLRRGYRLGSRVHGLRILDVILNSRSLRREVLRHRGRQDVIHRLRQDERHLLAQLCRQIVKVRFVALWQDEGLDASTPCRQRLHLDAAHRKHLPSQCDFPRHRHIFSHRHPRQE